CARHSFDYW
nr:immunoglobulin heavy chain junction region [Mus musculus]MBK4187285.1 immunoglobulin heavy chain junction region [Mus musculus]